MPDIKFEVTGNDQELVDHVIGDLQKMKVTPNMREYTDKLKTIGDECKKIANGIREVIPLQKAAVTAANAGNMALFTEKWTAYQPKFSSLNAETGKAIKDGKLKVPTIPAALKDDSVVIEYNKAITGLVRDTQDFYKKVFTTHTSLSNYVKKAIEVKNQRQAQGSGSVAPAAPVPANGVHSSPLSSSYGAAHQNSRIQAQQNNAPQDVPQQKQEKKQ